MPRKRRHVLAGVLWVVASLVVWVASLSGLVALVLIPTPYTFWASLAITLVSALVAKKTQGPGEADDHGISMF